MDLAIALAAEHRADLVVANDPDADRCAVAVPDVHGWRMLRGDEVGALLAHHLLARGRQGTYANSIVSSSLIGKMAAAAGQPAPRPEDFGRLLDKVGEAMAADFDFTEEVRGLQVPTLIVAADADMAPPSHYVEVFELLDGGLRDGGWMGEGRPKGGHALAILPGLTHYNLDESPLFAAATLAFLDEQPS